MPPEEPAALIAIDFKLDNGKLTGNGERIYPLAKPTLFASWYSETQPKGYCTVCGGLVFVEGVRDKDFISVEISNARPVDVGGRYQWREPNRPDGIMFAMVLPERHTLLDPDPMPQEVKNFKKRLAVHWRTPPPAETQLEISWSIRTLQEDVDQEVQRVSRVLFASRRKGMRPEYDVALSYASEDREFVEQTAAALGQHGITYFYDRDEETAVRLWGTNLYDHLSQVYSKLARYTVMFISKNYANKRWTNLERQNAQARAFVENREYVLPARFDDTEIPGLLPTIAYVSLKGLSPAQLAEMIKRKVELTRI